MEPGTTLTYVPARGVGSGEAPGTRSLLNQLLGMFPGTRDSGIFNPRDFAGNPVTSRTPVSQISLHAEGRAGDLGIPNLAVGQAAADWLVANAPALGVQEVIFNRRRWTAGRGWVGYSGRSPHTDHVHFSQTPDAAGAPGIVSRITTGAVPKIGATIAGAGGDLASGIIGDLIDRLRGLVIIGLVVAGGATLIASGAIKATTGRTPASHAKDAGEAYITAKTGGTL